MPTFKIKGGGYQNTDEVGLTGVGWDLIDGYTDEFDSLIKRPGLKLWKDIGSSAPILGLYYWAEQSCILASSNAKIYSISDAGVVTDRTTNAVGSNADYPPIFAGDGTYVWIASGGAMVTITGAGGKTTTVVDVHAPTSVSHVAYLDGYILANTRGSGKVSFTDPVTRTDWDSIDYVFAESDPDNVIALHTMWQEVFMFGNRSVEVWYNDGVTPFARIPGAKIEMGCVAAYTVCMAQGVIYWLNDRRRLVRLMGRQPEVMFSPYQKVIDKMTIVYNAKLFAFEVEGKEWLILTFPTENISFCIDTKSGNWYQWGKWNSSTQTHDKYLGHCSVVIPFDISLTISSSSKATGTGSSVTYTGSGSIAWSSPTNIQADDTSWACASFSNTDDETEFLWANNFGFTLAASANIVGAKLTLKQGADDCGAGATGTVVYQTVKMVKGGAVSGNNMATGSEIMNMSATKEYGGQASLWGNSLLYTDVNASNFGFVVSGKCTAFASDSNESAKTGGTFANDSSNSGTITWADTSNAGASDDVYATATFSAAATSQFLKITNFGYALPSDATVLGIRAVVERSRADGLQVQDSAIQLVKGGTIGGDNKKGTELWNSGADHDRAYGSSSSLWGETWTYANINASTFGIAIAVQCTGGTGAARIDCVTLTVYYSTKLKAGIQYAEATIYYSTQNIAAYDITSGLLIGDVTDDKLYSASSDVFTDNGATIKTIRRTGHITYDTLKRKRSKKLLIRTKKGVENAGEASPTCLIRWRDDNSSFNTGREISLSSNSDTNDNMVAREHQLGIYKSRQYEITHEDPTAFVLVELEEEVDILDGR